MARRRSRIGSRGRIPSILDRPRPVSSRVVGQRYRRATAGQDKLRFGLDSLLDGEATKVTVESGVGSAAQATGPVLRFDTKARELWFDYDGQGSDFEAIHLATIDTLKSSDVLFV